MLLSSQAPKVPVAYRHGVMNLAEELEYQTEIEHVEGVIDAQDVPAAQELGRFFSLIVRGPGLMQRYLRLLESYPSMHLHDRLEMAKLGAFWKAQESSVRAAGSKILFRFQRDENAVPGGPSAVESFRDALTQYLQSASQIGNALAKIQWNEMIANGLLMQDTSIKAEVETAREASIREMNEPR